MFVHVGNKKNFEIHTIELLSKQGCVFLMVFWPEFCMGWYRDDHREDALRFVCLRNFMDLNRFSRFKFSKLRLLFLMSISLVLV